MDRNPEADRRLMWALVLTMAVMYVWSTWFAPPPPPAEQVAATAEGATATAETPTAVAPATAAPTATPTESIPEARLTVSADGVVSSLDSRGGALTRATLSSYTTEPVVTPIWRWVMAKVTGPDPGEWQPYAGGGEHSVIGGEAAAIAVAGVGAMVGDVPHLLSREGELAKASRALPEGVTVTKTFRQADSPYVLDVVVTFENRGTTPVTGLWVGVLGEARRLEGQFDNAFLPVALVDGDLEHLEDPAELFGSANIGHEGPLSWFGFGNRYFMSALLPQGSEALRLVFDDVPDGRVGAFAVDDAALAPGQTRAYTFKAYAGPKDLNLLERVGNDLDQAVEFGFFGFFSKVLLFMLELFQRAVGNWGLAIIVLTFTVKLIFFPLTQKSLVSSRRMQQIQPRLKALQEQYKDDPMKQQQETMKLFSENNVNPLGGCLPMLVQIPVWFGLYSCLLYAVELYNSSFVYIRDLTSADPFAVLPTVAGVLFYVQQSMTPMTGMDPTQQKIMKFMPVIFAVFLYSLPAGLVFYMTVNAILSILQTWLLNRTMPAPPAPT